jgi:hypothetical protein
MSTEAIVIVCSFLGSALGTFGGVLTSQKLTNFRLKQLEDKMKVHNNAIERITTSEQNITLIGNAVGIKLLECKPIKS